MEKLRDTALACYDGFSDEQKDKAYAIFEAMDSNGDGTVSLKEYEEVFGSSNRTFFEELDTDGNGKLDFEEFITLFYILLSSRAETATSPLVKTIDQKSSGSNEVQSGSRSGRTRTEAVQSAIHKFNTAWTFGSAVGAVATSAGLCSIM